MCVTTSDSLFTYISIDFKGEKKFTLLQPTINLPTLKSMFFLDDKEKISLSFKHSNLDIHCSLNDDGNTFIIPPQAASLQLKLKPNAAQEKQIRDFNINSAIEFLSQRGFSVHPTTLFKPNNASNNGFSFADSRQQNTTGEPKRPFGTFGISLEDRERLSSIKGANFGFDPKNPPHNGYALFGAPVNNGEQKSTFGSRPPHFGPKQQEEQDKLANFPSPPKNTFGLFGSYNNNEKTQQKTTCSGLFRVPHKTDDKKEGIHPFGSSNKTNETSEFLNRAQEKFQEAYLNNADNQKQHN